MIYASAKRMPDNVLRRMLKVRKSTRSVSTTAFIESVSKIVLSIGDLNE